MDPGPGVGVFASLGIDSTGKPAIAYYDRFNQDLKFARWTGSAWTISVLDATQYAGLGTLVSFDGTDHPVVAYIGADSSGIPACQGDPLEWFGLDRLLGGGHSPGQPQLFFFDGAG